MHDAPAVLQVELEKLYDKHDKTQMEMRKVHGELEKYKNETASLEAEVERRECVGERRGCLARSASSLLPSLINPAPFSLSHPRTGPATRPSWHSCRRRSPV